MELEAYNKEAMETSMAKKSIRFKGWLILLNESLTYDVYIPEDADEGIRYCREECTPEMEDFPTIEDAKDFIRNY